MTWPHSGTRGIYHGIAELDVAVQGGQRGRSPWEYLELENKDFAEIVKIKGLSFWVEDKTRETRFH